MSIKDLIDIYGLNKNGLTNGVKNLCACGKELSKEEKACPHCGNLMSSSKLVNVNRNTAIEKRCEMSFGEESVFSVYELMSNGLDLYQIKVLEFSFNKESCEVKISDDKRFKKMDKNADFFNFLKLAAPGFLEYVQRCLNEFNFEYAKTKLTSLNEGTISNFLKVFFHYNALKDYLRGYKVFYYGNRLNLEKYLPGVDFNDATSVTNSGLFPSFLLTWDIKNEKYFQTILDFSLHAKNAEVEKLSLIISNMFNNVGSRYNPFSLNFDDIFESFSILWNKEISLEDFIRIYNGSQECFFSKIAEYRSVYKKMVDKNVPWASIPKINHESIGSLTVRAEILKSTLATKKNIEEIYETLEDNPFEALKKLSELEIPE